MVSKYVVVTFFFLCSCMVNHQKKYNVERIVELDYFQNFDYVKLRRNDKVYDCLIVKKNTQKIDLNEKNKLIIQKINNLLDVNGIKRNEIFDRYEIDGQVLFEKDNVFLIKLKNDNELRN